MQARHSEDGLVGASEFEQGHAAQKQGVGVVHCWPQGQLGKRPAAMPPPSRVACSRGTPSNYPADALQWSACLQGYRADVAGYHADVPGHRAGACHCSAEVIGLPAFAMRHAMDAILTLCWASLSQVQILVADRQVRVAKAHDH